MAKPELVWRYVYLSFFGVYAFALVFVIQAMVSGIWFSVLAYSVMTATFLASPLIGLYALYRVIRLATKPRSLPILLALLGFAADAGIAAFMYGAL